MKSATCRDCETVFEYESRRGRPPVQCEACKNPPKPIELDTDDTDAVELDADAKVDWGGPYGFGTTENSIIFKKGDEVKISGEHGVFRVYRDEVEKDGSYTLYGGSKDPGGIRGFRSIMPSRLSYDKRKKLR